MEIRLPFGITLSRKDKASSAEQSETAPRFPQAVVKGLSGAPDSSRDTPNAPAGAVAKKDLTGGRQSVETLDTFPNFTEWDIVAKQRWVQRFGFGQTLDFNSFRNMTFEQMSEILADISPEISKALWDFLLLCNPGFEVKCFHPGTKDLDEVAQAYMDDVILAKLSAYNGALSVFFDRVYKTIFLRGSFLMELVLDDAGYEFVDIATPDPATLTYRRKFDELRGQCWDFGQRQLKDGMTSGPRLGGFVSLNIPTVRYVPVHPNPDSIEGHSLCSSAFFLAVFLMAVLRDTKRVVQHQGYLRLDVEILFDKLRETMPTDIEGNPKKVTEWMQSLVDDVTAAYASLEPDDTYVHPDTVKVNKPVGSVTSDSLGAIDALFKCIERMAVRALKTMPILMGTDQSRSETQANREWEIYAKGIESVQHPVENALEDLFTLAMQAYGYLVDVEARFAQFRAAEQMRDEQVALMRAQRAALEYDRGWISQDEAAQLGADKEVADQPEPRVTQMAPGTAIAANNALQENPNPGEGRSIRTLLADIFFKKRQPTLGELDDAEKFLDSIDDELLTNLYDADNVPAEPEDTTTVIQ